MFTRSPQCVHSTGPWIAGLYPGAVPKWGLSASGERPRQPLMHSLEPGVGMYGIRAAYGFENVAEVLRPSISDRLTHVRHIESGFASTCLSSQCSSNSQSPTWIVCVTMSEYEYCGTPPSRRPGWFWP